MANFNTTLYTGQLGGAGASLNAPAGFPLAKVALGKLRIVEIPYVLAGTEAANDIINLTILRPGARVIAALSKVVCQDPGTTLTVQIGDASNRSRYSGTIVLDAGGVIELSSVAGTDLYVPTDVTVAVPPNSAADQTVVTAKVIAAAALTAANKLLILLAVVEE